MTARNRAAVLECETMTDPFIDRIAELTGQTKRTLEQVANDLEGAGLEAQASILRSVAKQHGQLAHDCLTITQPIEIARHNLRARVTKLLDETQELSAEMMSRGKEGHSELSDAAALLERALEKQDQ